MAADAEEAENLFTVAFGNMEKAGRAWSEELAEQLGVSAFRLRENAATINVMTKSMGLSESAAFEMSTEMAGLAEDMASFFNLDPQEAFDKLRAGITGETEPLKRLGILIDDATISQVAWEAGIARTGEKLTQLQKVEARRLAIMQQTRLAQGDLTRTAGSLTNMFKRLQARTSDMMIELGQIFIPIAKDVVGALLDMVEGARTLITAFKRLKEPFQKIILVTIGLVAALGPVVLAIGTLLVGVGAALPFMATLLSSFIKFLPVLKAFSIKMLLIGLKMFAVIAIIALLVVAFKVIKDNLSAFGAFFESIWEGIKSIFFTIIAAIVRKLEEIPFIGEAFEGVGAALEADALKALNKFIDKADEAAEKSVDFMDSMNDMKETLKGFAFDIPLPSFGGFNKPDEGGGDEGGGLAFVDPDELFNQLTTIADMNIETISLLTEQWLGFQASWNTMWDEMMMVSSLAFTQFRDGFAKAIADTLVFGKNFGESMKKLMLSIAASIIQFLVKIGIERVAQAAIAGATAKTLGMSQIGVAAGVGGANLTASMLSNPFTAAAAIPAGLGMAASIKSSFGAIAALATGGITQGSTIAEIGEKGKEAVIPLEGARGRNAMSSLVGSGLNSQTIIFELDGEAIAQMAVEGMPDVVRVQGILQ